MPLDASTPRDAAREMVRDCLAVRTRLIARTVTALYDGALEPHGITCAQVHLLAMIEVNGRCTPSELGELLRLERSTISRNLELLLEHGWVVAVERDGKGIREVALAAGGRRMLAAVLPAWRDAQEETLELLGADGVRAVRWAGGKLMGTLDG